MKYELINPSDPYTFEAPSLETAALLVCLLGEGKYGAKPIDDTSLAVSIPPMLFGHDEWFVEHVGCTFEESLAKAARSGDRLVELATALESVSLQCQERSSLNDIGAFAAEWASVVRGRIIAAGVAA